MLPQRSRRGLKPLGGRAANARSRRLASAPPSLVQFLFTLILMVFGLASSRLGMVSVKMPSL